MPARKIRTDLSVFTIDTNSQLLYLKEASVEFDNELAEISPITQLHGSEQVVRQGGTVRAKLMSTDSAPQKITNLYATVFSVGGTDYIADLDTADLSIEWEHEEACGAADRWKYPVCVAKKITLNGKLKVASAAANAIPGLFDATITGLNVTVTMTINGVAITMPMVLKTVTQTIPESGIQTLDVVLHGRAPDSGTYPTAPTGTTTLLEQALNATAVNALVATTRSSNGESYSGNGLIKSYRLSVPNPGLIIADIEWATQGAWSIN